MANLITGQLRAKYPPQDGEEDHRADAAATFGRAAGEQVCTLRTRATLTQTERARRMSTTQSSTARIEGGGLPSPGMLARLVHATGIPYA